MRRSPEEIQQSSRRINRRTLVLGVAQFALLAGLGYRMRQLQVEEADNFRLLAEENRINIRLLPPVRGLIFDRDNQPLAENIPHYSLTITREDAGDVEAVFDTLRRLIRVDEDDLAKAREELQRRSSFVPVTVIGNLDWQDVAKVSANAPALPGINVELGHSRIYAKGADFAHVVGYVGPVSDYDLSRTDDNDPLLQIPRFQIGKLGVEARLERDLRGAAGNRRVEVNAVGREMRELERIEPKPGRNVTLSLDSDLQAYILARMDGLSASAVVMDCQRGDILALGSAPSFDPNLFVRGISVADYSGLRDDPFGPLRGKAVQGTYAPASTFKMVTALAALEAGVVGSEEDVNCPGHLEIADGKFHCWRRGGHGKMNLVEALRESCDVYFYDLSQRVGIDRISAMARQLGLGIRHELPLSSVQRGVAPTKDWKMESYGKEWVLGDSANASIGQGYVLASPLQLAIMTARLATGRAIDPRLVLSTDGNLALSAEAPKLDIDPFHLKLVHDAMYAVSNHRRGTGFGARILERPLQLAGKTGTAQVRNISAAERAGGVIQNEDLPWDQRDHALFVNYAPVEDPKIAVAVVVEHGGGGGAVAAPIARDITLRALTGDMPPLRAYPSVQRNQVRREQAALRRLLSERAAHHATAGQNL